MADGGGAGDEITLAAHLAGVRVQAGVEEGRWRILRHAFPELLVEVTGQDFTGVTQVTWAFCLLCDGFPVQVPFVERWDAAAGQRPAAPTAEEAPPGVVDAFKDWQYGGIYRAWQRHGAVHNNWAATRPDEAWRRDRDLSFILEKLYGLASEQAAWLAARAAA